MVVCGCGLLGQMFFEQVDKAVVGMGIADGAELPTVSPAIDFAEDQGAFPLVGRLRAEGIAGHFLALAIHGTDVGRLDLAEVLPLLDALVNTNKKQDTVIIRRHRVQLHDNLLIIISSRTASAVVPAMDHRAAWVLTAVEKDDVSAHELVVANVAHHVLIVQEKCHGIEIKLCLILAAKDATQKAFLLLTHLPPQTDGDLVEVIGVFAQVNGLPLCEIDGHVSNGLTLTAHPFPAHLNGRTAFLARVPNDRLASALGAFSSIARLLLPPAVTAEKHFVVRVAAHRG